MSRCARDPPHHRDTHGWRLSLTETSFSLKAPSLNVVYKLLSKVNERKSAGLDNIPNKLLKMSASIVSPFLALIFAKSIETGIFPDEWKLARVTPIFKKSKRDDPNNYRPISVIPTVAKIFEKCVCDQLSEYLNANNQLSHCQSGFRSLHSTLTALVDAANSWSVNIDNGLVNGVVFIDLRKAFDTALITIFCYGSSVYMVLIQSVFSGLNLIFSAEVRDVVLLASCLMLHRFLVASHRVAT